MSTAAQALEQGVALLNGGRFHEAAQVFGAVLRANPQAVEPRRGLARALLGIGDGWAAAAWLSDACRSAPHRPELWLELAQSLIAQQRHNELEPLLHAAVAANPDSVPLLRMQGELYLRHRAYAPALRAWQRLYELQPQDPATLLNYGFCLEQTFAVEKSVMAYRQAIAQKPDFVEAHVDLAGVLWRLEDFEGALVHAQKAVELAPEHPYAVRILGTAYLNLNRLDEAEAQFRRALQLQPHFSLAEIDLSFTLLLAGKLKEGWEMYALRWRDTERMKRPAFFNPQLEWKGREAQPLQGKRIAIYAEQGLGDVIQFVRYVRHLQADGATVVGVVQAELVALIEHSMEGMLCLTPERTLQADYHVALLELPLHYGTTMDSIPAQGPYLRAPKQKITEWAERMPPAEGRLRVGLAWSGSLAQVNNNNRAMRLSQLMPIIGLPQLQCFSLQKANVGPLSDVVPVPGQLLDLTPQWSDFIDSAAMIENLDLVITVDTSIAHLAGAIGKEVWVLLAPNADWRWLLEREDSPWYPSLRLFRRGLNEPRVKQVERVMKTLQARLPAIE
jgi:tetratricopeptide (TPR) repeat protein